MACRPTRFGLRGRRTLLRAGGAIDRSGFKTENCLFLTGTIAGSTDAAIQTVADYSGYLVDRLKSWLSKFRKNRKEFYVWEWQDRGALHLHYGIALEDKDTGEPILKGFHREWRKLMLNISEMSGVDVFAQSDKRTWKDDESKPITDAQRVYKSAVAYVAKYAGKSIDSDSKSFPYPSRWWGISRPLNALLLSLTAERVRVFANVNSARKWIESIHSEMQSVSDKVMSYTSKCKRALVNLCYHKPTDFQSVRNSLFEDKKVDFILLRDGSSRHSGVPVSAKINVILAMLPQSPLLSQTRYKLHQFANERVEPLDADSLRVLKGIVNGVSFLDSCENSESYEHYATMQQLRSVSNLAWRFYGSLQKIDEAFFPADPLPESVIMAVADDAILHPEQLQFPWMAAVPTSPVDSRWN